MNSATPRTRLCPEDPFLIDPAAQAAGRLSASSSCPLAANLEQAVTSDTLVERGESQGSGCAKFRIFGHFLMWEALPPPPPLHSPPLTGLRKFHNDFSEEKFSLLHTATFRSRERRSRSRSFEREVRMHRRYRQKPLFYHVPLFLFNTSSFSLF